MPITISPKLKLIAATGIIAVTAAGVTLAAFTDTGNVETSFSSGTLDLKFDDDQDGNPDNYLVDFSAGFDAMAPGHEVSRDLEVFNSGSITALLGMGVPTITNAAGTPADAVEDHMTLVITDITGGGSTELYNGELTTATFPQTLDIGEGGAANGRTLHFSVTLDTSAPIGAAGQDITVVFPFSATQS